MREFRQVSCLGGMKEVEPCHHDSAVEGCSGCDGPAYVLAAEAYAAIKSQSDAAGEQK